MDRLTLVEPCDYIKPHPECVQVSVCQCFTRTDGATARTLWGFAGVDTSHWYNHTSYVVSSDDKAQALFTHSKRHKQTEAETHVISETQHMSDVTVSDRVCVCVCVCVCG